MNASKLAGIRANATLKCASHPRQTPRMLYAISTHRTTSQLRDGVYKQCQLSDAPVFVRTNRPVWSDTAAGVQPLPLLGST